jgi:hypothetical protein
LKVYGVDFTSAPSRRKGITVAAGTAASTRLAIEAIETLEDFPSFERFLARSGPWVAGFDFPFGLAREAVVDLGWPTDWTSLLAHCGRLGRREFKRLLDGYRITRPAGSRYAKRRGDAASGAHPSVKLVNPPVGFMFFEGARRLSEARLSIPGLQGGADTRIALEAYPGLLVRRLAIRESYKSDTPSRHTPARRAVRARILACIEAGEPLGIGLSLDAPVRSLALSDGAGDALDAILCAIQACWGWQRRSQNYGLPADLDQLEGWIVSA